MSQMDIEVQELKSRLDKGDSDFEFIDVREPYERDEYHIGGELIPLEQFVANIPTMEVPKDREIVLYCRSGKRSGMAVELLRNAGYSNARNLLGGVVKWQEEFE